ncbi:MAG: hypothetical protein ACLRL4_10995 [Bifidobacterium bifidum]
MVEIIDQVVLSDETAVHDVNKMPAPEFVDIVSQPSGREHTSLG